MVEHGFVARLTTTKRTWLNNERRRLDPAYAAGEFFWYFDPDGSLDMIRHYAKQYDKFANGGIVLGAYGPRIRRSLPRVVKLLDGSDHSTRRAVLPLFNENDLSLAHVANDVPCTLSWNFAVIDDALCMTATMRSNDAWLGLPYDIFVNTCVQRFVAGMLRMPVGWYQHQVMDLHLYDKHKAAAYEAVTCKVDETCVWDDSTWAYADMSTIDRYLELEHQWRHGDRSIQIANDGSLLSELFQCISYHKPYSEALQNAHYRRLRLRGEDNVS